MKEMGRKGIIVVFMEVFLACDYAIMTKERKGSRRIYPNFQHKEKPGTTGSGT